MLYKKINILPIKSAGFTKVTLLLTLVILIYTGCNTQPVKSDLGLNYRLHGAIIQDMSRSNLTVVATLTEDNSLITDGILSINNDGIPFFANGNVVDSTYQLVNSLFSKYAGGPANLSVKVGSSLNETIAFSVVDTLTVDSLFPQSGILQPPWQLKVDFSFSTNATAYALAAVKAGSEYSGKGYSAYVQTGINSGTIPPDAFLTLPNNNPDTGLYNIYVYAISGQPDSTLASLYLPVPIPGEGSDNFSNASLSGRIGAVSVSRFSTINVVASR